MGDSDVYSVHHMVWVREQSLLYEFLIVLLSKIPLLLLIIIIITNFICMVSFIHPIQSRNISTPAEIQ